MRYDDDGWRPYVSAAERRRSGAQKIAKLRKSGRVVSPVEIEGLKIARTFWGQSWCNNLEAYSDYSNRLPRGRTYARNSSVIDLQIEAGRVRALVNGSIFYNVEIRVTPLAPKRWQAIKSRCAGKIDSVVELLHGSISKGVMEIVTRKGEGLFPAPKEISLGCSCPDWATMCKHVAAALYGVGARLDHEPEMLFRLRGVEPAEMIAAAIADVPTTRKRGRGRILKTDDVSAVFGIDLDLGADSNSEKAPRPTRRHKKTTTRKATRKPAAASRTGPIAGAKTVRKAASAKPLSKKKPQSKRTAAKSGTTEASASKTTVKKATATTRKKTPARAGTTGKIRAATKKKRT